MKLLLFLRNGIDLEIWRDTTTNILWLAIRATLLAGWVFLAARLLGPGDFAVVAGLLSLFALLTAVTSLGLPMLFFRRITRSQALFIAVWRESFGSILVLGSAGGFVLIALAMFFPSTPVSVQTLFVLAVGEGLVSPVAQSMSTAAQAQRQFWLSGMIGTVVPLARMATVAIAYELDIHDASGFLLMQGICVCGLGIPLALGTMRVLRLEPVPALPNKRSLCLSSGFAAMNLAYATSSEADKPIVARFVESALAGEYAFCSRLFISATLPVQAVCGAMLPRLAARRGCDAKAAVIASTWWLMVVAAAYAIMSYAGIALLVPWIERWLGSGYSGLAAVWKLQGLALVPFALRQVVALSLVSLHRPWSRVSMDLVAGVLMITILFVAGNAGSTNGVLLAPILAESVAVLLGLQFMHGRKFRSPNVGRLAE